MKIAIHQPNFFPWLGFWIKLAAVDTFILYTDCSVNTSGLTHRVRAKGAMSEWLIAPLQNLSSRTLIHELRFDWNDDRWDRLSSRAERSYADTPYGDDALSLIYTFRTIAKENTNFSELQQATLVSLSRKLGIDTKIELSTDYPAEGSSGTRRLLAMVNRHEYGQYISGSSLTSYASESQLKSFNMKPLVVDFSKYVTRATANMPHSYNSSILYFISLLGYQGTCDMIRKYSACLLRNLRDLRND